MSDFNDAIRLQEEQEKTLMNCELMIEKWEKFKEDYEAVDKLLNDLPKKTTHDIMVPMGPLAFMPGKLVHTNEIMVLLGDNWFAERSATQAIEIAKRRLKSVEEYLGNLHKEHENILSHMAFTTDVVNMRSQNDFQEIKEELTEKDIQRQDNKSKRVAHTKATKHSVKKVDLQDTSSSSRTKSKEDENLFARLEELERQEQTNNELENEQYFADSTACSTTSEDQSTLAQNTCVHETLRAGTKSLASSSNDKTCSSKDSARNSNKFKEHKSLRAESCSFVPQKENTHATNVCTTQRMEKDSLPVGEPCIVAKAKNDSDTKHLTKKVKWKENVVEHQGVEDRVVYPKENATIYFTHSSRTVTPSQSEEQSISSPAHILTDYLSRKESTAHHPTSKDEHVAKDEPVSTSEVPELKKATRTQDEKETTPQAQAFSSVVVEHKDIPSRSVTTDLEKNKEQKTEPRKISKFKASRMKNN